MKNLSFLTVFFFMILSSFGQSFGKGSTEAEFVEYFKANKESLDLIEGIWIRKSTSITTWKRDNRVDEPLVSETETAIVIIQGKITAFTIMNGYSKLGSLGVYCMLTKSAIPKRYSFSADLTDPFCSYVFPVPFGISNNYFSFSYDLDCHTGTGVTLGTAGSLYGNKVTEVWNKIYPDPE